MTPDGFKLTIELGNDAMQTSADIARALRSAADRVESSRVEDSAPARVGAAIRDDNGNTVGRWEIQR